MAIVSTTLLKKDKRKISFLPFTNAVFFVAGMLCMSQLSSFNASDNKSTLSNLEQMSRYDSRLGAQYMVDVANSFNPITDKVAYHEYEHMYGQFLLPYYRENPNMKFLEIGLGCNMNYDPGKNNKIVIEKIMSCFICQDYILNHPNNLY